MTMKDFDPGLDVRIGWNPITIDYGPGIFGPDPEYRRLRDIRPSLKDPDCDGPDPVYGIAMDVGRENHRAELRRRHLLFGVVAFAAGRLGREPVRSQGHVHKIAAHSGWSAPELFEIWSGRAMIYMQESVADNPGRCFAIDAGIGDKVVVPPGWAHTVISADPESPLVFAAWCERDYGFVYEGVRAHGGLAWFPECGQEGIRWEPNPRYSTTGIEVRRARSYPDLGLQDHMPLYRQFEEGAASVEWVAFPDRYRDLWPEFQP
jgi:glucose-6-phosphate isomerase